MFLPLHALCTLGSGNTKTQELDVPPGIPWQPTQYPFPSSSLITDLGIYSSLQSAQRKDSILPPPLTLGRDWEVSLQGVDSHGRNNLLPLSPLLSLHSEHRYPGWSTSSHLVTLRIEVTCQGWPKQRSRSCLHTTPRLLALGFFFYEREVSLHLIEAAYLVFSFRWLNLNLIQQPILCLWAVS